MNNVFALNAETQEYDGEKEFLSRSLEGELKQRRAALEEEVRVHQKNAGLPVWLNLIAVILGGFGVICVVEFLMAPLGENQVSYAQAYANAPWVIWVGPPCLIIGVALYMFEKLRKRQVEGSPAFAYTAEKVEKLTTESLAALGVPEDAPSCDVFSPVFKIKKGGTRKRVAAVANYYNGAWKIFREGDDLCLGDATRVLKIPANRIGRLVRVNKRAMFAGWNKETPCNKGEYKQYKIKWNNYGAMFVKPYLSLQIKGSEEAEILFPPYEAETVQRLTGRFVE